MSSAAGYVTDVAYVPGFYPNLAPSAIRYVASLNRVAPPKIDHGFNYLELGCGLGRSLTTLAAANPMGQFVGVDINPEHTALVQKDIDRGALKNARIVTADFAHLPNDLPTFDFIAMHGVLSWVAPAVREQCIAVVKERLAPGGLFLVSYNAMPGWAHLQPIRGILRQYAILRQGDSVSRMREGLQYLVFIRDKHAKYFEDNPRAAAYVDGLLKQDVRYLVHEYLNEHWTSFYFAEVASMFRGADLSFAGSLPVHTNFWDLCVRPEFQELFRTTQDRLVTEAHKDFCANTAFRWDIFVKSPRLTPDIRSRVEAMDDLFFSVTRPGTTLPFQTNLGVVTSTVQGPIYQTLLETLGSGSMRMSEILATPKLSSAPKEELARAVDAGVAMGLFDFSSGPISDQTYDASKPLVIGCAFNSQLLKNESLSGRALALASTLTGTGYTIGDFDASILDELVQRGHDQLADRVDARLVSSGRSLQEEEKPVTDVARRSQLVKDACDRFRTTALPQLFKLGIVTNA